MDRRDFLKTGAAASIGGLAACTPGQTPSGLTQQVIDAIQAAVGQACNFIPNVQTLLGILAMFPAIGNTASIASTLLTEVTNFLCAQFKSAGGVPAAINAAADTAKNLNMTLKDNSTAPLHGYVWDPKTNTFVAF